jgi:CRP/FNR family transcriptional regulator, cyclic AMP receptor protein
MSSSATGQLTSLVAALSKTDQSYEPHWPDTEIAPCYKWGVMKTNIQVRKSLQPRQASVKSAQRGSDSANWERILHGTKDGKSSIDCNPNHTIFTQGEPAFSLFYVQQGKVKLTATSKQGKEAIIAVMNGGEFFGEGCLSGQKLRMSTATAMMDSKVYKIEKSVMRRMLDDNVVSKFFVERILSRNIRYEEDLADQLFNNSERRLARILLLSANFGEDSTSEPVVPKINQEDLAQMVGTTRARVSHFMNKFKKQGFIDYKDGHMTVHNGLLKVVLGSLSKDQGELAD